MILVAKGQVLIVSLANLLDILRGISKHALCKICTLVPQERHWDTVTNPRISFPPSDILRVREKRWIVWPKMNTIVFNKLSSQVLFEEKAKEVEMSSRNYLEVIDGQHPDLLSSNQTIRDNQAIRHRRSGYVERSVMVNAAGQHVRSWINWSFPPGCYWWGVPLFHDYFSQHELTERERGNNNAGFVIRALWLSLQFVRRIKDSRPNTQARLLGSDPVKINI